MTGDWDQPPAPQLPGQLALVDPCEAPACLELPSATVRVGPMPAHLVGVLSDVVQLDHCLRLRLCPEHVTPFVDATSCTVDDVELPVTLRWDL